jgi:hypothetical protein
MPSFIAWYNQTFANCNNVIYDNHKSELE